MYAWHRVACLPDIPYNLENWLIVVVVSESSLSLDPLARSSVSRLPDTRLTKGEKTEQVWDSEPCSVLSSQSPSIWEQCCHLWFHLTTAFNTVTDWANSGELLKWLSVIDWPKVGIELSWSAKSNDLAKILDTLPSKSFWTSLGDRQKAKRGKSLRRQPEPPWVCIRTQDPESGVAFGRSRERQHFHAGQIWNYCCS